MPYHRTTHSNNICSFGIIKKFDIEILADLNSESESLCALV